MKFCIGLLSTLEGYVSLKPMPAVPNVVGVLAFKVCAFTGDSYSRLHHHPHALREDAELPLLQKEDVRVKQKCPFKSVSEAES